MKMELNEELTAAAAQLGDELASACAPHQAAAAVVQLQSANTWHAMMAVLSPLLPLVEVETHNDMLISVADDDAALRTVKRVLQFKLQARSVQRR